jgi:mono/diheme cytochrome c family protein
MPPHGQVAGGPLNTQEINDLITFINYGDFDATLNQADSAVNLDKDLPTYSNTGYSGDVQKVKQIMLAKGCVTCHMIGTVGGRIGPPLEQVGSRRTVEWLRKWIKNPASVPAGERGPNLWLVAPTPGLYTPKPSLSATPTPQQYPMNTTFMPTIPMTDEELNTLVDYLAHARTGP